MGAQYVTQIKTKDGNKKIDYNALANLPSIPEKTSDLENDKGFLTEVPVALDNTYGGIKAEFKSDNDNVEVKIGLNGKLYVPEYPDINDFATTTVNYTEQNLTDEQKAQARKNIDVPSTGDVINAPTTEVVPGHLVIWDTDSQSVKDGGEIPVPKEIDTTLTISGAAADAKIVGDKINSMNDTLSEQIEELAKNSAVTLSELPETGSESVDYFIGNAETGYKLYRWIDGEFRLIGGDVANDVAFVELSVKVDNIETEVEKHSERILAVENELSTLGNVVTDAVETEGGLTIHYSDGTTKDVKTMDDSVLVEDIESSLSGILVTYSNGEKKEVEITGSGSGDVSKGYATISRLGESSIQCLYGGSCEIGYNFAAYDATNDIVGDGEATWYIGSVAVATSVAYQGDNTFDIGKYLNVGTNNIKLSISVDTGGDTPTVATKTWTINAIKMYIDWEYDETIVNNGDTFTIRWTPYGDLLKTTHIVIDGSEVATSETTRNGTAQTLTLDSLEHGGHLVRLYLTATINDKIIPSDSVYHGMMFDRGKDDIIIASSYPDGKLTQYNTAKIKFTVYDPNNLTADVKLAIDGIEIETRKNVDRTVQEWNYTPSEAGMKVLTISSGDSVRTINIDVEELDIDNEEIQGYAFKLKASDLSGNEALKVWNSNGVDITFSNNFDWHNGGIKTELDEYGNSRQYICIKAGTTATINYELFANDAKVSGKNLKVIFKTMNCRDRDSTWLTCMDEGIGIELYANNGVARSVQNETSFKYKENSYIELDYDISSDSSFRYIQTYFDGVLASTKVYAEDDNFTQSNKKKIVIGSLDCDVYIYLVKAYEFYLTRDDHIENFIADAPNANEMLRRYERNDILNTAGEIDYEKLAAKNQNCRVHLWDIPRMTEGKKDYVTGCSYQQIYKGGDKRHQITANNVTINIQGTSSVDYKDSGANTDGNFTEGFTDGNGEHIDGYSMSDDSIPVNYFNTKVNIASCENINNMCIAEWYDRHQPYKTAYKLKNPNSRDCMEHNIGVQFIKDQSHSLFSDDTYHMYAICNMGNSKNNGIVFHDPENPLECCIETKDNHSTHCMMLDPSFDVADLDTEDFFEFRYPESPTDTMKNAFVDLVRWFANGNPANATDEELSEEVTFEPYTFRGTGQEGEVLAGHTISDYAGTYTHDTYEYRMAKMLSECEDHLIMDSIVYHYVFVEQHAMVDNVCKNSFWGTEDLVHWHLVKNYDNDTADGNDNNGKLIIPFGSEGFDTIQDGNRDVFNGCDNVYWGFVYGLYEARRIMWTNRESFGDKTCWNAEAYLAFAKERQNYIPERVYNQDYWYKYLRLYETKEVTTYLDMLEGGKKTHQRESFVTDNMYYMASQYMGTTCTGTSITLRGYTPSEWSGVEPKAELAVAMYNKGYIVVQIGSALKRLKVEKGVMETISFAEVGNMNDTVINIHGANLVQEVGDISCLYVGRSDFSAATRLRSITIGSTEDGYANNNLTNVSFGTNTMLEEVYIQNCPNATVSLDLSGCQALKILDIRGSGFTGVTFALGGLIERAWLCSPASLSMRSLYNLTDENLTLEDYSKLTSLRFEDNTQLSSLNLVNLAQNLNRVRIIGIDWILADTSILTRLLYVAGTDESNHNIDQSVLVGHVYVPSVKEHDLLLYNNAWQNLDITYDTSIPQYALTFYNEDGTPLLDKEGNPYIQYVDSGQDGYDPVVAGEIDIPVKESTAQYDYTYSGWICSSSYMFNGVTEDRQFTAQYSPTLRTYTVKWINHNGIVLKTLTDIPYGSSVSYDLDMPTRTDEEIYNIYYLFDGWDKFTGFITEDTTATTKWQRGALPLAGTDLSDMTPAEIYAIVRAGRISDYMEEKDAVEIQLGYDVNYSNVQSVVLAEDLELDGGAVIDTGIKLFDEDRDFVIAIDYSFDDVASYTEDASLVSCFNIDGYDGFEIYYNGGAKARWGTSNSSIGYGEYRNICVLRHVKGDDNLRTYFFDSSTSNVYSETSGYSFLSKSRATSTNATLVFGGRKFLGDGTLSNFAKGKIHWAKIWYTDLGEDICKKLVSWNRETRHFEYYGAKRYLLSQGSAYCNASFIMNGLLEKGLYMNSSNTNVGGWDSSYAREWLNNRFYNALPDIWKTLIKQVKINASAGDKSTEIITSNDYIYIPAYREMLSSTTTAAEPYVYEGSHIGWFDSNIDRIAFKGIEIPEGAKYYEQSSALDPTLDNSVNNGDVWVQTDNGNNGYIYQDGEWIAASIYWTRSANVGYSTYFMYAQANGSMNGYNSANTGNGIRPCFSI